MAKSKDGPFGKLSGSVGNLVFATWRGIPYIRSRPSKPVSNTPAQQTQRSKFGFVVTFVGRILPVIKAGFKWGPEELPARNTAISYLMKNAVRGEKPDIWMDYSSVLVARGDLPPPREATVERGEENRLTFRWRFNEERGRRRSSDEVLALAYCPELEEGVWSVGDGASRLDEELLLGLPDSMSGKEMHVYLAFVDAEGTEASDSVYLGTV